MRNIFFLTILFVSSSIHAQNASEILQKSYDTCKSIEQGYYEVESNFKYFSSPKVYNSYYKTYFNKDKKDPIYSFYFNNKKVTKDTLRSIEVYNGDTQIRVFTSNNKGLIMSNKNDRSDMLKLKHNLSFYSPFLHKSNHPLNLFEDDKKYSINYLGIKKINNSICYYIQAIKSNHSKGLIKHETYFWIDTTTFLPTHYTEEFISLIGKDTQTQFETVTLHKLETDILLPDSLFSRKAIPDSFQLKNYVKYVRPKLLEVGTQMPNFHCLNLSGDSIQLSDLKGKVVLIDFFYKSCYPCVLALPHIQALHEKYKDKGLVVLGIDPYDKKEVLEPFLKTQGITYDALLGNGKEISEKYHVSGYPCIYILNKNGEVILAKTGYLKGWEKQYKKTIKKALKE